MSSRKRQRSTRPATVIRPERGGWWAMVMLLSFLAVSVAALLFSYFHLFINAAQWPPEGIEPPDLTLAGSAGAALLASSLAVYAGVARVVRGDRRGLAIGLAVGLVLGVAGVGMQLADLVNMPFTAQTNVYGSLFFALGGFILLLLAIGIFMLATIQLWVWLGYFGPVEHLAVVNVGLYWYFVVAAWVPVFATLYVTPNLLETL